MYAVILTILLCISLSAKNVKMSKNEVSFKQYAHSVFLHYPSISKASDLFCGGSLILAQVVVTSADCLEQMHLKDRITAYFGSSQPSKAKAKLGVLLCKIHPKYKEDNVVYNLGVVFLGKPPPMGPYIRKIILPIGTRHKSWDDEYLLTQPKESIVTKSRLPGLVQLQQDLAKKSNNTNKQFSSYTVKVISGAVTEAMLEKSGRKHRMEPFENDAFMVAWAKRPSLSPLSVLSSRHLTGYRVHLLSFDECNSFLNNPSPLDTICTRSKFNSRIYDNPGCSLIVKKPMTQLIGIYSRSVRGVAVFINVDSHRSWIKHSALQLYKHACNFGQLACSPSNASSEEMNCTLH